MTKTVSSSQTRNKLKLKFAKVKYEKKMERIDILISTLEDELDLVRVKQYEKEIEKLDEELQNLGTEIAALEASLSNNSPNNNPIPFGSTPSSDNTNFDTLGKEHKFKDYFTKLNFGLHKHAFKSYLNHDKKHGVFAIFSDEEKKQTWLCSDIFLKYDEVNLPGSAVNIWPLKIGSLDIEKIDQLLDQLIRYMELKGDFDIMPFETKLEHLKDSILARLETESIAIVIYRACDPITDEQEEDAVAFKQILKKIWEKLVGAIEQQQPKGWLMSFFVTSTNDFEVYMSADEDIISIKNDAQISEAVRQSIEEKKLLTLPEVKEITASEFHLWIKDHLDRDKHDPGYPFKTFHEQFKCEEDCEAYFGKASIHAEKLFVKICEEFNFKFVEDLFKCEIQAR